jgi:hypothetical protein
MDMQVVGYKPVDEKWTKMRAVRDACLDAGVPIPEAVEEFFERKDPDPAGVRCDIPTRALGRGLAKPWTDRGNFIGIEVNLTQLRADHADITMLRFEVESPKAVAELLAAEAAAAADKPKPVGGDRRP